MSGNIIVLSSDVDVFTATNDAATTCTVKVASGSPSSPASAVVSGTNNTNEISLIVLDNDTTVPGGSSVVIICTSNLSSNVAGAHKFNVHTTSDAYQLTSQDGYTPHGSAASIVFISTPSCGASTNCASFSIEVRDSSGILVNMGPESSFTVSLSKVNGSGNIGGTTSATAVAGIATFGSVQIDAAGSDLVMRARVISPRTIVVATSAVGVSDNSIELSNTDYAGMSNGDALLYVAVGIHSPRRAHKQQRVLHSQDNGHD